MLGNDSAGPKVPIGGSGLAVVKAESKDRQDAAAKVLKFMAEPENCAEWHLGTGYLPIVLKAAELPNVKANVKKIPNYGVALDQVKNSRQSDTITWFDAPVDDINRAMGLVYGDGKDPKTVVTDLQKQLDEKMAKYKDTISKVMTKGN
jgi:sn-glycerol 3-phosphate transport system substrate-binding protein